MPKFFCENIENNFVVIKGEDATHITKSLRMKLSEVVTVCDLRGNDYLCEISEFLPNGVKLLVKEAKSSSGEPNIKVTLYQALPKADKMEYIIQKSVELGVYRIVPVITSRCVSRPDKASLEKKLARWNKISEEAAKQCGRGILPQVSAVLELHEAINEMKSCDTSVMFYEENGGLASDTLKEIGKTVGVLIGPEGGFEPFEAKLAQDAGITIAGMGPRILRAETAPLCALSVIMFTTGNI